MNDKEKIIIDTPYDDRGCYNCYYHMILKDNKDDWCELHKYILSMWKWCEGWEHEK